MKVTDAVINKLLPEYSELIKHLQFVLEFKFNFMLLMTKGDQESLGFNISVAVAILMA